MEVSDLLARLHLSASEAECRTHVRAFVDALEAPRWSALRDRRRSGNPDTIDDAILWRVARIAGPTLHTDNDEQADGFDEIVEARAAVALGDIRASAAAAGLSPGEFFAWSRSTRAVTPAMWLLGEHGLAGTTEYVTVARWAVKANADPRRREALHADRDVGGVGGSVLQRLDELRTCDLSRSVLTTLENACRRIVSESWDGPDELAKPAKWEAELPDGCTRIRTFTDLHAEGTALRHCVGTDLSYAEGIVSRRHEIISIRMNDGTRATAQVAGGKVVQCSGHGNSRPSEPIMRLAAKSAEVCGR